MNEQFYDTPAPPPVAPGPDMYDRMKQAIYNPWFQFGLGVLGGNSGKTKGEAFANAMQGGQQAAQFATQQRFAEAENARAQQKAAREQQAFDEAMKSEAAFKKFATSMADKNPGDPFWQSAVINPQWGLEFFKAQTDADYKKANLEIDRMKAAAYAGAVGGFGGGGGGGSKSSRYTIKDMSESDFKNLDAMFSSKFGDKWDKLTDNQKRAYALEFYASQDQQAKAGVPFAEMRMGELPQAPTPWWQKGLDFIGGVTAPSGKPVPQGTTPRGMSRPGVPLPEGWSVQER